MSQKLLRSCQDLLCGKVTPANMKHAASIMQTHLQRIQTMKPDSWFKEAWRCINILWEALSHEHEHTMPEMACQRSGRCCAKQVPRVSMFEAHHIAEAVREDPHVEDLKTTCLEAITARYNNSILGTGVPCPMLKKDANGVHSCRVHNRRPLICRLSSISTALSWDCPIWQVYKTCFPTLAPELVRPLLDLFSYCRNVYCRDYLGRNDGKQMMLLAPALLAFLGVPPPDVEDKIVTLAIRHKARCSEELYLREMESPPEGVDKDDELC